MFAASRSRNKFYGWIALGTSSAVLFVSYGAILGSFGVFLSHLCRVDGAPYGAGAGSLSAALAMMMIVMMLSGPLAGWFIGAFGPRTAMVCGNGLCVIGLLLLASHTKLWHFYIAYGVCLGLGTGIGGMLAANTVASNWFIRRIPLAISIIMTASGLGAVLSPVVNSTIDYFGWRLAYVALSGLVFLVGIVIAGTLVRNRPEDLGQIPDGEAGEAPEAEPSGQDRHGQHSTSADFSLGEAIRTKTFWILVLFSIMVFFPNSIVMAHQVKFLEGIIGTARAAGTMVIFAAASTIGTLLTGALALKVKLKWVALAATMVMCLGLAVSLLAPSMPLLSYVFPLLFGLGGGSAIATGMAFTPAFFGRSNYSKIAGVAMVCAMPGWLGAPVAGVIFDLTKSYTLPLLLALSASVATVVCMLVLKPPR